MRNTKRLFAVFLLSTFLLPFIANAQYTKIFNFSGTLTGYDAEGSLISDGVYLYGMTNSPGAKNSFGVIFKIKPDGTGYTILHNFVNYLDGFGLRGTLFYDGLFLYGLTTFGGLSDFGTIFKIKPNGTEFTKLLDFSPTNGSSPMDRLISDGVFLYGMTELGGLSDFGTIFKIKPDGTEFTKLLDFNSTNGNGWYPYGSLYYDGTFLYGMTSVIPNFGGGGTIFKIRPDGSDYNLLSNLPDPTNNGRSPIGTLISDGVYLYGMTRMGGTSDSGVVFRIKPDGSEFFKLHDLNSSDGGWPNGSLIIDGAHLYGMTAYGGKNNAGVIFKLKTDGTEYTKLYDFDSINGSYPYGSLFSDGIYLYGTTSGTGNTYNGVIFKIPITTKGVGIVDNFIKPNSEKLFDVYPNPNRGKFKLRISNVQLVTSKEYTIEVYNLIGEKMYSTNFKPQTSNTLDIDILNAPKGMYFIKMTDGENSYSEKIVIE